MKEIQEILAAARNQGQQALSEYESKRVLAGYGLPVVEETLAGELDEVRSAAAESGIPLS